MSEGFANRMRMDALAYQMVVVDLAIQIPPLNADTCCGRQGLADGLPVVARLDNIVEHILLNPEGG